MGKEMDFIIKRGNQYYYNRRVPKEFQDIEGRKVIRFSLNTDSIREALKRRELENELILARWKDANPVKRKNDDLIFEELSKLSQLLGFQYLPNNEVAKLPIEDIGKRLVQANKRISDPKAVCAILGGSPKPVLKLSDVVSKYFHYSKGQLWNKSDIQIKKWENPRILAMQNLVRCLGNKELSTLTKKDILKFRDWWLNRLDTRGMSAKTANKNIIHVKTMISTVNDSMDLGLDTDHLFRKVILKVGEEKIRAPFTTEYIRDVLLNPKNLQGLNEQARWALHAMAETGAGASEQASLAPEDIQLNCEIPHIIIRPKTKMELKTRYRKRIIPLVGFALDAFKACPQGFTSYFGRPDSLSTALGKYMRENNLFPTSNHTIYSLRHSFQDRLLAVNAPDRVQADLMGHKFNRPSYGDGASLQNKLEWLSKIQLK